MLERDFSGARRIAGKALVAVVLTAIGTAAPAHDPTLVGASLRGAPLSGAELAGADFSGADLWGARLDGADLVGARLVGAELRAATLAGADLRRADLAGARLRGAWLTGADLRGARLGGAALVGADLRGTRWPATGPATLHGADLRGAVGLTQAALEGFVGSGDTLLPDGPAPDTGQAFFVWRCWERAPAGFATIVAATTAAVALAAEPEAVRAELLCPGGRKATGTPLAADAPRPAGHPLGR
jgi:uncharacterized protein YjbI with pentapeptide repeats